MAPGTRRRRVPPYRPLRARRTAGDGTLAGPAVLALGVGTRLPDLVDEPLAWSFALLPSGRTLAHSAPVTAAVLLVAARRDREGPPDDAGGGTRRVGRRRLVPSRRVGVAFSIGYASHLLSDLPPDVLVGDAASAGFLLRPVVPAPAHAVEGSWGAPFPPEVTALSLLLGLLSLLAVGVRLRDDAPGLDVLAVAVGR